MKDLAYQKFYFCHICRKEVDVESLKDHEKKGHQIMSYETMPKETEVKENKNV